MLYVGGAWVLIELGDILVPAFNGPQWVLQALIITAFIGFPISIVLAWFYELTEKGFERDEEARLGGLSPLFRHRTIDFIVIGVLMMALVLTIASRVTEDDVQPTTHGPLLVLIADFDFGVSEDRYPGVLEEALRVGLEVAPFIEVFSRGEARKLANEHADSNKLGIETAALIGIRQGIDIVIYGEVSKTKQVNKIELRGVHPVTSEELYRVSEVGQSEEGILSILALAANSLRSELGYSVAPKDSSLIEAFTTSNLEAAREFLIGQELSSDRQFELANDHYARAVELDPDFARAYSGWASAAKQNGNSLKADQLWEAALSRLNSLTDREQLRTLGLYYALQTQNHEKAQETYERLVERYPADTAGQNNVAVAAFYNLDFEKAKQAGQRLVERHPQSLLYKSNLALYLMYGSDLSEANRLAQELVQTSPDYPFGWIIIALTELISERTPEAKQAYLRLADGQPFAQSLSNQGLADLAIYQGEYEDALGILQQGIKDDLSRSANVDAATKYLMTAEAQFALNRARETTEAISSGLALQRSEVQLVPAAILYIRLGELDLAGKLADELSSSLSRLRRAYADAIRAEIAMAKNQPIKSIEYARTAVDIADIWFARFVSGRVYLAANYPAEAFSEFKLCSERIGEGLSMFLDDHPTYRYVGYLELETSKVAESLNIPNSQQVGGAAPKS